MELGAIIVFLLVAAFAVGIVWVAVASTRRHRENLEWAAARTGGVLESSFWRGAVLRFEVDGVPARLTYFSGSDKAPPWTKVHFDWTPPGRLHVGPEGFLARLRKTLGAEDHQLGDPRFDEAFLIQGEPVDWLRRVLDEAARRALLELYELGASWARGRGASLEVNAGGVIVRSSRNLVYEREQLGMFLERSAALLQGIRAADAAGGVRVTVSEAVAAGHCPVCASAIASRPKACRSCRTPYHPECWSYLGGCAVFGCGDGYRARARAPRPTAKEW